MPKASHGLALRWGWNGLERTGSGCTGSREGGMAEGRAQCHFRLGPLSCLFLWRPCRAQAANGSRMSVELPFALGPVRVRRKACQLLDLPAATLRSFSSNMLCLRCPAISLLPKDAAPYQLVSEPSSPDLPQGSCFVRPLPHASKPRCPMVCPRPRDLPFGTQQH